jgi:hypothetical protein
MKNWLRRKMHNFIFPQDEVIQEDCYTTTKSRKGNQLVARDSYELDGEPLRFNVFRANGGTVVQTHVYDRQKDRSFQQLHIIGHDEDLGASIGKIITMESLRG